MATFRNVLKVARDDGLIDVVPATPRVRQKDNPRAFFRFAPLVPESKDEYKKLLDEAKQMAKEGVVVRGVERRMSCTISSSFAYMHLFALPPQSSML